MTNFIPIFPLEVVVFPGEQVNLHIFEPRYIQLINDLKATQKPFGIPSVIRKKVSENGVLVNITEIVKTYDDGKMDIRIKGDKLFRILEIIDTIPDKLYHGAIVSYPNNDLSPKTTQLLKVLEEVRVLHRQLNVSKDFRKQDTELTSYDIGHHAGLSLEEEYEFVGLLREDQRIEYLRRHLQKVLDLPNNMKALQEKIRLNGHFRELKGLGLDI
jgi:Lon protease-like protein